MSRQLPPEMEAAAEAKRKEFEEQMRAEEAKSGGGGGGKRGGPKSCCCYICGKQCLMSSFEIHQKGCIETFQKNNPGKPLPRRPDLDEDASLEERDAAAQEAYKEDVMAACPGCGRRFRDEATMHKHQKGCHGGGGGGGRQSPQRRQASAEDEMKEVEQGIEKEESSMDCRLELEETISCKTAAGAPVGWLRNATPGTLQR